MKRRTLVVPEPGRVEVVEEDLPAVPPGGVLLETLASGVSAGTELTFVKGDHPGLHRRHDTELGLFLTTAPATPYPVGRLGYMEVGRVVESRGSGFTEGELVAAAYGHSTAHVADPVREHLVVLPPHLDPLLGVYVAHLGPICANGLLHAAAELAGPVPARLGDGVQGRRVAVVGAGQIGLLAALFAREAGAAEVVVLDADPRRRAVASALGFLPLDTDGADDDGAGDSDPARIVKTRWRHGPSDHGADVVLQCRGRPGALALALRLCRPQGVVVDLAFYTEGAGEVRLGEEFHHNGLSLRCAQIGRTPRGTAGHWDRHRLSVETVRLLDACGPQVRRHLVTDVVAFDDGPRLLLDVAHRRRHVVGAVLVPDPSGVDGP
ncbi:zinc-binding alcohol dehydrogenase [Nocardioides sp. CFH 31398]|uniref:zinc-dependent alcohol dehydrogenase n=1 Tax=Nocardioides sp. CFH 31398 TaxID=2919579 RepID=UPI001F0614C6|nr:zinc-binding alcohol dehydrogenase [Nocardioides sp. CFH 31398]MCH1867261.1 zinc-binding alcohol dehydrogenase [Nocardioides sp. CFH 31398]